MMIHDEKGVDQVVTTRPHRPSPRMENKPMSS